MDVYHLFFGGIFVYRDLVPGDGLEFDRIVMSSIVIPRYDIAIRNSA